MSELPPEPKVHVGGSRVRCPYCHDDVLAEASDWVACAGCLARHHRPCWDEAQACSACGAAEPLVRAEPRRAPHLAVVPDADVREAARSAALGGPRRLLLERCFTGQATIDDAAWLQATVRRTAKVRGRVSVEGRSLVWRPTGEEGCRGLPALVVSLTPTPEGTRLRIEEELVGAFGALVGVLLGGAGVLGLVFAAFLREALGLGYPMLPLIPIWLTGLLLLVRGLYASHTNERLRRNEKLLTRLTQGLTWAPPPPSAHAPPRLKGPSKPEAD